MSSNLLKRKNLPKTTKDLSKEQVIEILKKKKECNDLALRIVEGFCDQNIGCDWFLSNLIHINQSHYDDVVTERSIQKFCGYPLCNENLGDIPKQKYRISLTTKNVYDITERKMFCSGQCFKASNYLKEQLLTSPLWFRDSERVPTFKIMSLQEHVESLKETHKESSCPDKDIGDDDHCEIMTGSETMSRNLDNNMHSEYHHEVFDQVGLPILDPVAKIEKSLEEWFSINTYLYLMGEEKLKLKFIGKDTMLKAAFNMQSAISLKSKKFEDISKLFSVLKLDVDDEREPMDLKPLPDYSFLKEETKSLNIKVKAFYSGQLEISHNASAASSSDVKLVTGDLPFVDSQSQTALRRKVLLDQLNRVVPDVCVTLGVDGFFGFNDIRSLTHTFVLSAHNVTFKSREWCLLATIIIKMFSLKFNALAVSLRQEETKKRITLLLMSYNLKNDFLDNLLEWLTDTERISSNFQS